MLLEWLTGSLAPQLVSTVEQHVDGCEACSEVLRNIASRGRSTLQPTLLTIRPDALITPIARGTSIGRYLVVGMMGYGGMGIVYAAYDPELDRKVALKLLRADPTSSSDAAAIDKLHERLRREAQAMARLSHPNVVTVFDVGVADGQLFIAMELVEGATLARWLSAAPREPADILAQLLAAGRGLAAAHAAGFVHRDFKPANVLIGDDGRVCVSDFGLARLVDETPLASASPAGAAPTSAGSLTETGMLVGTTLYMSPEQLDGDVADARSDQFSFCVTLYEALHGRRPFVGDTVDELRSAIASGVVGASVRGRRVKPWVRRVLLRGLRADPAQRYPSMSALLRDLGRDPAVARRRVALVAVGSLALLLSGVGLSRTAQKQRLDCRAGAARWSGVWDAPTKAEIHAAFARTGKAYAEDEWRAVERTLDGLARAWTGAYTDACEATHVRGEQSGELLDLRMGCLNRRLEETAALTSLFRRVDADLVDHAAEAVQGSDDLQSCSDVRALKQRRGPPSDAKQRVAYDALERELARLSALENAGKLIDRKTADELVARAERLDHAVLLSDALVMQGSERLRAGELPEARDSFHRAAIAGEHAIDDGRVAMALDFVALITSQLRQPEEAARLLEVAAASSERGGGDFARDAQHLEIVAAMADERSDYLTEAARCGDAAVLHHRASRPISEAAVLGRRGWALSKAGQLEEGARVCTDALGLIERTLGRAHPFAIQSLNCLANIAEERNHKDEAVAWLQRALSITEATYDGKGPRMVTAFINVGEALIDRGDPEGALSAFKKAEGAAAGTPLDPRTLTSVQLGTGAALLGLGRARESVPLLEAGQAWLIKNTNESDPRARSAFTLARALYAANQDRARALRLAHEAAGFAASRPPSPYTSALREEIAAWLHEHDARR
jgi:tetratricopeptide (TPR) repeat protein